jgi:FkbM family methyltransferase
MTHFLKQLLPHEFRQRLKRSLFAHADMTSRLINLRRAGFSPAGAIDGGAYRGDWTRVLWKIWPGVASVMIEPQPDQFQILTSLAKKTMGSVVIPKAISRRVGEVSFRLGGSNSSIVSRDISDQTICVACTTLDTILDDLPYCRPTLLKLDLQGHELEALDGAGRHFAQFEVIILEVSILRIGEVPIFSEVDSYMSGRGYQLYDLLSQYYRPLDGALWQIDAFYVRRDSRLLASRRWK